MIVHDKGEITVLVVLVIILNMILLIMIMIIIIIIGARDCTPEINTSDIIVDVHWHFQQMFRGLFQQNFIVQWYFQRIVSFPVDFHWKCPLDFQCCPDGISLL